ncbi:ABC-2 type transport system permease protein [Lachnospiraceae bacterium YSD2013]|jgi:ABC-2 type transport system permease protein|nr:ABC-2 type transport system permease protein [Lachnospiraceae bacterium YSD2013]
MKNRTLSFAKRNLIEMSRDSLSYIFCVAFPIVMLVIMSVVNASIPKEAGMTLFRIDNLAGGIVIFGQTFVMLFSALNVSKDRSGSFLIRLFASPMKSKNFTGGYILPLIVVAIVQAVIAFVASFIVSLVTGTELNVLGLLAGTIAVIPSAIMFIAIGMIFGTIFNEKAAPGMCSIIISFGAIVGGIWFDVEGVGGFMAKLGKCLPFLYATKVARAAIKLDFSFDTFVTPMIVVAGSAAVLTALACMFFGRKMRADLA